MIKLTTWVIPPVVSLIVYKIMKNNRILFSIALSCFITSIFALSCKDEEVQEAPVLELSKDTLILVQQEAKTNVGLKTNVEWTAKSSADWCTAGGSENTLNVSVTANTGMDVREAEVIVAGSGLEQKLYVKQLGEAPDILLEKERVDLQYKDTTIHVKVVSNVNYDVMIPETAGWINKAVQASTKAMTETACSFDISKNDADTVRYANITFKASDGSVERNLMIRQSFRDTEYTPGDPSDLGDILLTIASGEGEQANSSDESIEKSFDGTTSTWYHSSWYNTKFPVNLTYHFATPQEVDYFVYKPRSGGGNGDFGQFELFVSTYDKDNYVKIGDYDFGKKSTSSRVDFKEPLKNVTSFKFTVKSGAGDLVSCGEMEFYRYGAPVAGLDEVFADELYSKLKPDVDQRKIDGIENSFFRNIAQSLFDGTYDLKYRVQEYEPYRDLNDLAKEMKTGVYNPFENPTGIWFKDGEEVVIFIEDTDGESVQFKVYDFDAIRQGKSTPNPTSYPLTKGTNKIKLTTGGLGYIDYYTLNWETAPKIKIHIASGTVNGYFDKHRDTAADWQKILNDASYGMIDIKGDYINLCYGVNSLKQYCDDGMKLIQNYDDITDYEHEIMGLKKYNRKPKNHMFARVVKDGLFADGWGAGFYEGCMNELACTTKSVREGGWAIAHELGHVNQISPGLKWVSTTEVTNNVYSALVRYKYWPENTALEHERCNDGDNNNVIGGRFNSYLNYGIVKGEHWLCQKGQDKMEGYENGGDHFVKLCPLWQMLLYYREVIGGEKRDWYGDVAEIVRTTDQNGMNNGELNLAFMKNTMDVVKEDLTDFFEQCGMLKPINKELDDYARGQMTITQAQCDELKVYARKYPKPATPVLYYLSANCVDAYKNRLPVEGKYNEGLIVRSNGWVMAKHEVWRNAVVFETYQGDELKYVAMVGTDSYDGSETWVRYPEGSTRIEAVAWDGTRTLVYGKR